MITQRDVSYASRLSPVAQLLEMLGNMDQPSVRSPDVFMSMARDIWEVYWYLSARLNDELVEGGCATYGEDYFNDVERRAKKALE